MKVLITSGGTAEPVDGVRFLTNFSTGGTGAALARELKRLGHEVALLRSVRAQAAAEVKEYFFGSFDELDGTLKKLLSETDFDMVVHAAAVADYKIAYVCVDGREYADGEKAKIPSGARVNLTLEPTYKIIDRLPGYAKNRPLIIGFKLTNGADEEQARQAAARVQADWVVHNDLTDIRAGRRLFSLYRAGRLEKQICGTPSLAAWLDALAADVQKASNLI